ncbi:hypothetical protein BC834DRAFT_835706 [Gloeopeniophorella convolvens]|nr:hypothetical protein BC834DRAFT_835706 [Gloeopeniophorella convolvens]
MPLGDEYGQSPRPPSTTPSTSRSFSGAARTRKTARQRIVHAPSLPRKQTPAPRSPVRGRTPRAPSEPWIVAEQQETPLFQLPQLPPLPETRAGTEFLAILFHSVFDVLGTTIRWLKTPISLLLVLYASAYILGLASGSIKTALSPICDIPIISLACPAPKPSKATGKKSERDRTPKWADFPSLLNVESKTLEALLDETVEGPGLALEIKKAEMATSDLATLVRVSKLNSRDILAEFLSEFVKDARQVGRGLTRFSSRVGGAVDNIIAVNDYALHAIEAANSKSSALSLRHLWPFSPAGPATKEVVTRHFTDAMNTLSANMQRLVLEAEVSLSDLDKLEEHLRSIHEVVSREDSSVNAQRADLLAQLWTILGGNRDELRGMNDNLALLKGVGRYRDRALAHVVAALQMLQTMAEDMEELRERVAAPELVGSAIPVEVHMKSIRGGLERLRERRHAAHKREEDFTNRILEAVGAAKVDHSE